MKQEMQKQMEMINSLKTAGKLKEAEEIETSFKKIYGEYISNETYQNHHAISRSKILKLLESEWHFYKHFLDPKRPKFKETAAMIAGTHRHIAILEPDLFDKMFVCYKGEGDRRTKEYKEFAEKHKDKTVLKEEEFNEILYCRDAVLNDPVAKVLLKNGLYERAYFLDDKDDGISKKIKLDIISDLAISDIKKCQNANKYEFEFDAGKFNLVIQAAYSLDIYEKISGIKKDNFVLIAVEEKYPYNVYCYDFKDEDLNLAREHIDLALKLYKKCSETNTYKKTNYPIRTLDIPERFKLRRIG
jgi:hypothetical protein